MNPTRFTITTTSGTTHTGFIQGSGGRLRGDHGLKTLRHAADGRPVNAYDPTSAPPYKTGRQEITHVAVFERDEDRKGVPVPILGATIEHAV